MLPYKENRQRVINRNITGQSDQMLPIITNIKVFVKSSMLYVLVVCKVCTNFMFEIFFVKFFTVLLNIARMGKNAKLVHSCGKLWYIQGQCFMYRDFMVLKHCRYVLNAVHCHGMCLATHYMCIFIILVWKFASRDHRSRMFQALCPSLICKG